MPALCFTAVQTNNLGATHDYFVFSHMISNLSAKCVGFIFKVFLEYDSFICCHPVQVNPISLGLLPKSSNWWHRLHPCLFPSSQQSSQNDPFQTLSQGHVIPHMQSPLVAFIYTNVLIMALMPHSVRGTLSSSQPPSFPLPVLFPSLLLLQLHCPPNTCGMYSPQELSIYFYLGLLHVCLGFLLPYF